MNRIQKMVSVASVLAVATFGFVAVASANPQFQTTQNVQQSWRHEGRHGGHGGSIVHAALKLPSLRADQKTKIEALLEQEKASRAGEHAAREQLMNAVADGVKAGNVDSRTIDPKVLTVVRAIQANEPSENATLEKVHAILDPAQRAELVAGIEAREKAHEEHAKAGGERHEHREFNGGHLARELKLTPDQMAKIGAAMRANRPAPPDAGEHQNAKAERERVLQAFKGDRFVMRELKAPKTTEEVERGVERMVTMAKVSAPVLTAEQREQASAKIREMATHGKR